MPNKTLSVREEDLALWERAERAARNERTSVSALVASALADKLGTTDTCRVAMYEKSTPLRWEAFEGRWLTDAPTFVGCGWSSEGSWDDEPEERWETYVAETARGRIAVYVRHSLAYADQPPTLNVFEDLDGARRAADRDSRVSKEQLTTAGYALGRNGKRGEEVRWRDI